MEKPQYIKLEFDEKISPEEVNEIQFLTNNPYTPTIESNGITKLGDSFVFERTNPKAPGLKDPENPKKATNVYMYKIKKDIKFAYQLSTDGKHSITITGYRDWETDRKSTRLNSSHRSLSRMPSSA